MSAETDLVAALVAASGVATLVGARVRVDRAEETDALPFVAISREATEPYTDISSGAILASLVTLDVYCIAATRAAADALAAAVTTAVCAVPRQSVAGRRAEFDPEAGLMTTVLTVTWWE